jgi:hypothetical protein
MFEHLAEYSRIAVTGPQRSGTTIAAKMIADDTGHRFVDEEEFGIDDVDQWRAFLTKERVVVHCPHFLKRIVDEAPSGVLVVLTRRPLGEIHASANRFGWYSADWGNGRELAQFGVTEGDSAVLKYEYWDSNTRAFPHLEVPYASLEAHPRFRGPEIRRNWDPGQTE